MFLYIPDSWVHYWTDYCCLLFISVNLTEMLEKRSLFNDDKRKMFLISGIPVIALITTGVGLFEANALQFGLDQLLRGSYTETDCLHPLVLLDSQCSAFGSNVYYNWLDSNRH